MSGGYKRIPTLDEITEFASKKFKKDSKEYAYFVEGAEWTLSEVNRLRWKQGTGIMTTLKNMEVKQINYFPLYRWGTIRSAASLLKKLYGVQFEVHKEYSKDDAEITVTRIN